MTKSVHQVEVLPERDPDASAAAKPNVVGNEGYRTLIVEAKNLIFADNLQSYTEIMVQAKNLLEQIRGEAYHFIGNPNLAHQKEIAAAMKSVQLAEKYAPKDYRDVEAVWLSELALRRAKQALVLTNEYKLEKVAQEVRESERAAKEAEKRVENMRLAFERRRMADARGSVNSPKL